MTASWFESPTLTGDRVRLEPLGVAHTDALLAAADDPGDLSLDRIAHHRSGTGTEVHRCSNRRP